MASNFRKSFDTSLAATDVTPLLTFFSTQRVQRIVKLELDARREIMAPNVESAAKEPFNSM